MLRKKASLSKSLIPSPQGLRILVIGSGGREHAIALHLLKSQRVEHVYVAPGNGGTGTIDAARCSNLADVKVGGDFSDVCQWAQEKKINLCVPGPEQPLVDGIEAAFRAIGVPVFGPSPLAAQMEGSKDFSKLFMDRHNIPTAQFRSFDASQLKECLEYVQELGGSQKIVLKASGLAAGKGVLLPESEEECQAGVQQILVDRIFGDAGSTLLVESRLEGPELSILTFSDGYSHYSLPSCQDHKRIDEGDTGPNTGGMGAYSPAPEGQAPGVERAIETEVIAPTIAGMRKDGFPFVGLLFTGFMITSSGPKVLEYNVRFGDPETEAALELLDTDNGPNLADIMLACAERRLDSLDIKIKPDSHAVSVVLASGGYPGKYATGKKIEIGSIPKGVTVYHAGTKMNGNDLVTSGGRVLAVSASGSSLQKAVDLAYKGVDQIAFEGKTFRRDIAHRALRPRKPVQKEALTYAAAGVDVDAGNQLVEAIKSHARSTARPGCDAKIGGFGGVFDLKAAGNYKDPLLVSGTDGVGTKLRVALDFDKHDTVGVDLVAMSVNDLLVQAAAPLYFLDYFACSKLQIDVTANVVKGIAQGCKESNCGLIGGETAEMPGMYEGKDYDLAGFAVGIVERSHLLPRLDDIKEGDVLLGLRSSGLHSNGYSLVRKVIERAGIKYTEKCPWEEDKDVLLGDRLLEPTRIYVKALSHLLGFGDDASSPSLHVKALSHITGGGFTDNIPRILPTGFGAQVDVAAWKRPQLFSYLQKEGNIAALEMCRTLNNGIGMVLVVEKSGVAEVEALLVKGGEKDDVIQMGHIIKGEGVSYSNLDSWSI